MRERTIISIIFAMSCGPKANSVWANGISKRGTVGCAWSEPYQAWAFSMRNPQGGIIGIRLRDNVKKWSVKGSRNGLFFDPDVVFLSPVIVCEGPTDTAALINLGFSTVGRACCVTNREDLMGMMLGLDVVILSDRDAPGMKGAEDLARALQNRAESVKIIRPPPGSKDVRDWKKNGATGDVIRSVIHHAKEWKDATEA